MNAPFLHRRLRALEALLSSSNEALRAHDVNEASATDVAIRFLSDAASTYASLGLGVAENESLALRAELAGARRRRAGSDAGGPGRRREAERGLVRWVLAESSKRLRAEYERDDQALNRAGDEVAVLVHHAVDNGLVEAGDGGSPKEVWRVLLTDPSTRSTAGLLALRVAAPDLLLLVDERVTALTAALRH